MPKQVPSYHVDILRQADELDQLLDGLERHHIDPVTVDRPFSTLGESPYLMARKRFALSI